ncbi:hypothetical protein [Croceimicrobium hydrocarbonivorans]|uniref:Uncharacterized protein n=1 Tax=Croceimicrobium hydrocarbonivorans TaxID=2761580 RepID=A0A7H0VBR0_9FLAO|nr:hypothetical protein [Croceimicrobium hydrocarbonivorans]QNR23158.1 hypothetical protein H4K34_12325 [Croceimicrobium hydrocarbonivorans]
MHSIRVVLLMALVFVGLEACSQVGEKLSIQEAEHHYLGQLFKNGIPNSGWLVENVAVSDTWDEMQIA